MPFTYHRWQNLAFQKISYFALVLQLFFFAIRERGGISGHEMCKRGLSEVYNFALLYIVCSCDCWHHGSCIWPAAGENSDDGSVRVFSPCTLAFCHTIHTMLGEYLQLQDIHHYLLTPFKHSIQVFQSCQLDNSPVTRPLFPRNQKQPQCRYQDVLYTPLPVLSFLLQRFPFISL